MEYPTLITAFGADDTTPGYDLERTVVHEIGHQYFYGMVASNEFEEAWLDEGFTSYAEDKLMEQEYGLIPNLPVQSGLITSPAPLTQPSWKFDSQNQYASNVYTGASWCCSVLNSKSERRPWNASFRRMSKISF